LLDTLEMPRLSSDERYWEDGLSRYSYRYQKALYLRNMQCDDDFIMKKLMIPSLDEFQSDINAAEKEGVMGVFASETTVAAQALSPFEPFALNTTCVTPFDIPIKANAILIDMISVRTSDPGVPYSIRQFESASNEMDDNEDMLQMEMKTQRTYMHTLNFAPYRDADASYKYHGAIELEAKPLRPDKGPIEAENEYYNAPVEFEITLRYKLPADLHL